MNKKKVDWNRWLSIVAIIISIFSVGWNIHVDAERRKAHLEVWQRNAFYEGASDHRTQITLLFRNLSHRPTAVVDIYVRAGQGILGGSGYDGRIALPIQIEPWGIKRVDFRIESGDEQRMSDMLVKDIEDNEIVVKRSANHTWTKSK